MSLSRVRHGLSSTTEALLIVFVALLGVAAILLQVVEPFADTHAELVTSLPGTVSLDVDEWTLKRNADNGFEYAVPPGWVVEEDRDRIVLARAPGYLKVVEPHGSVLSIEIRPLGGTTIEDLAAQEFAGRRPALYDVSIDSRPGLFAVAFDGKAVGPQALYLPIKNGRILVARGDGFDPAAFSVFISSITFFTP